VSEFICCNSFAPWDVAVGRDGSVFVVDANFNYVVRFSRSGVLLDRWGGTGSAPGLFRMPEGIAVDIDGSVFVADTGNGRIQKFTASGEFLLQWNGDGSSNGYFNWPRGVACDRNEVVYVADQEGVRKFTSDGTFLGSWGGPGTGNGQFMAPHAIDVDAHGNVYVVESTVDADHPLECGFARCQRFDTNGDFLGSWGSCRELGFAHGIAIGPYGDIYVSVENGNLIQHYRLLTTGVRASNWSDAKGRYR
jgi:DNA-binding beta-propeller fold protein YncE